MVVGEDGTNGGLWCSPVANTSSPTSSALSAIVTMALIRSRSLGVTPVVGSIVTSPTEKIPNCITLILSKVVSNSTTASNSTRSLGIPPREGEEEREPAGADEPAGEHVRRPVHAQVDAAEPDQEHQERAERGEQHTAQPAGPLPD